MVEGEMTTVNFNTNLSNQARNCGAGRKLSCLQSVFSKV